MSKQPPKTLKFEAAMQRLDAIVAAMESGEIGIEESIARYEEAMALAAHCRQILDSAEQTHRQNPARRRRPASPHPLRRPPPQPRTTTTTTPGKTTIPPATPAQQSSHPAAPLRALRTVARNSLPFASITSFAAEKSLTNARNRLPPRPGRPLKAERRTLKAEVRKPTTKHQPLPPQKNHPAPAPPLTPHSTHGKMTICE